MTDDVVTYQSNDRIAVITINRPEKLNALTGDEKPAISSGLTTQSVNCGTSKIALPIALRVRQQWQNFTRPIQRKKSSIKR